MYDRNRNNTKILSRTIKHYVPFRMEYVRSGTNKDAVPALRYSFHPAGGREKFTSCHYSSLKLGKNDRKLQGSIEGRLNCIFLKMLVGILSSNSL